CTEEEFVRLLHDHDYDIILADHSLPTWNGLEALKSLRELGKETPFILVTGSLGEERAVECLKAGASDYVLKDRIVRLPFAVKRALAEHHAHSERKRLEQQLLQTQKMETVGRLAGGIAHDFNNLLNVIGGYAELLRTSLDPDSPAQAQVAEIQKASERASGLTRQLLAFSRQQVLAPVALSLNAVVEGMQEMVRRLIGEDIELLINLAPELGSVKTDPGQMEQVIMNLVVNARDAMPEGGRLVLQTANIELDDSYCRQHVGVQPGPHALLSVNDTGVGMEQETLSHIFEPFFTTKDKSKGTGLGLATVYGIIKQSGGSVWAYSEPGKGSMFNIYLPRVDEPAESIRRASVPEGETRGTETLLVVEDEEGLRRLISESLRSRGYTVITACDGREAFELAEANGQRIRLLLTDVVLPQMSGGEVARQLTALYPTLRVIYMSGYTDRGLGANGDLQPGLHFLQKPFSLKALAAKIREVLDA
ncbi:MAG: response regulator, partial [Candidatus Acidiferrales bacterium]